ncbi:EXS family-domain-containing protein [Dipodascopsis uninucleata]
MKFAKYLEDNRVPEWKFQYLDYKHGKKKLNKLSRKGVSNMKSNFTDATSAPYSDQIKPKSIHGSAGRRRTDSMMLATPTENAMSRASHDTKYAKTAVGGDEGRDGNSSSVAATTTGVTPQQLLNTTAAININPSRSYGFNSNVLDHNVEIYGSLIATPPTKKSHLTSLIAEADEHGQPIDENVRFDSSRNIPSSQIPIPRLSATPIMSSSKAPVALTSSGSFPMAKNDRLRKISTITPRSDPINGSRQVLKYDILPSPAIPTVPNEQLNFELNTPNTAKTSRKASQNIAASFAEYRARIADDSDFREFMEWLDGQFEKIESFYGSKEIEASARFDKIREQLHVLRDQRLQEREKVRTEERLGISEDGTQPKGNQRENRWNTIYNKLDLDHLVFGSSKQERDLVKSGMAINNSGNGDYRRRPYPVQVPYKVARRKLKLAIHEYYLSLELLKSYRLLNRTGFQKITKKLDKTIGGSISPWYMDKVSNSYFGQSNVVDDLMSKTEDIYARYFERGSRKQAIEKLRTREKSEDHYFATFSSGIYIGIALPLFIHAIVVGIIKGFRNEIANVPYLFQLFAGAFLMILFGMLFALNCMVWTKFKINYPFIFEFNRHKFLDYREFLELPAFYFLWLSICMWFCFQNLWPDHFPPNWYPLLFTSFAIIPLFLPIPIFHWNSREWFIIALWRLFFSGLYPVEFRDFFLGDIFNSLAYSMSNIDLFFCLYARDWRLDTGCGSSRSRLMGFLNALPAIWRFLQCWRRYYDTKNRFPHLANALKYSLSVLTAIFLSFLRIDKGDTFRAFYITFASCNALYSSFWDIFMDWSLFQTGSKHKFLRNELGFRRPVFYYVAMVVDPILRFNWIFYIIFEKQVEQSAVVSFFIALTEIIRRFIWVFFRVENEHCTNVGRFVAARTIPLPYETDELDEGEELDIIDPNTPLMAAETGTSTALIYPDDHTATSQQTTSPGKSAQSSLHRRRSTTTAPSTPNIVANASSIMRIAHAQDFERRRRPNEGNSARLQPIQPEIDDDSDSNEDTDDTDDDLDDDSDNVSDSDHGSAGHHYHVHHSRRHNSHHASHINAGNADNDTGDVHKNSDTLVSGLSSGFRSNDQDQEGGLSNYYSEATMPRKNDVDQG